MKSRKNGRAYVEAENLRERRQFHGRVALSKGIGRSIVSTVIDGTSCQFWASCLLIVGTWFCSGSIGRRRRSTIRPRAGSRQQQRSTDRSRPAPSRSSSPSAGGCFDAQWQGFKTDSGMAAFTRKRHTLALRWSGFVRTVLRT